MQKFTMAMVAVLSLAGLQPGQTYSLAGDWSDTANPNGTWTILGGGVPLPPVPNWIAGGFSFTQPAWAVAASGLHHIPAWMKMAGNSPSYDILTGDVMMHSWDPGGGGSIGETEVTWTCPAAGIADISGSTWMTRDIGRANDWNLRHNGVLLRTGMTYSGDPYDSSNPFDFGSGTGSQPLLGRVVSAGDVISLGFVQSTGQAYGDFNAVRLIINLLPALGACAGSSFTGGSTLLTIDGSTGGPNRIVSVALNQPFVLGFGQPPFVPFAASFLIFGRIGIPNASEAFPLPLGIGTMCFAPALLVPADPMLLTVADSFTATGLLPATPAPWNFPIPGLPVPVQLTLQGATYSSSATLGLSNALVLNVY